MTKKKDVSVLVSALGVLMSIITVLVSAVRKRGGTDEDIYRLATPDGESLIEKIAELIVQAGQAAKNIFGITVDYGLSLADMIATGRYDWKNNDINSDNFPFHGKGKVNVNVELVHFKRNLDDNEVTVELERMGYRDLTLPELLAFGAKFPDKQREFLIIARGSVWQDRNGNRNVACLNRNGSKRNLNLYWLDYRWNDNCRFAVVRNSFHFYKPRLFRRGLC